MLGPCSNAMTPYVGPQHVNWVLCGHIDNPDCGSLTPLAHEVIESQDPPYDAPLWLYYRNQVQACAQGTSFVNIVSTSSDASLSKPHHITPRRSPPSSLWPKNLCIICNYPYPYRIGYVPWSRLSQSKRKPWVLHSKGHPCPQTSTRKTLFDLKVGPGATHFWWYTLLTSVLGCEKNRIKKCIQP